MRGGKINVGELFFREDWEGGRIFYNLFQMDGKKEVKKEDIFFVLTVLLKKHGRLYNSTHGYT